MPQKRHLLTRAQIEARRTMHRATAVKLATENAALPFWAVFRRIRLGSAVVLFEALADETNHILTGGTEAARQLAEITDQTKATETTTTTEGTATP